MTGYLGLVWRSPILSRTYSKDLLAAYLVANNAWDFLVVGRSSAWQRLGWFSLPVNNAQIRNVRSWLLIFLTLSTFQTEQGLYVCSISHGKIGSGTCTFLWENKPPCFFGLLDFFLKCSQVSELTWDYSCSLLTDSGSCMGLSYSVWLHHLVTLYGVRSYRIISQGFICVSSRSHCSIVSHRLHEQ